MKRINFVWILVLLGALLVAVELPSQATRAAEIKVFCLPGMSRALDELGPKFEALTGHKVATVFEVNKPMMRRIDSGDEFDVVIVLPSEIDELIKRGKVVENSRVTIARTGIGVWIQPSAPKPDISTVEAFKRTLIEAKSISYTKESGAGIYLAGLMERLGIADEMRPKTKFLGGGGQNPRAVATGEVQYGLSIVTDGIGLPGVELLGPLPQEIQQWFVFVGGISANADNPEAARGFVKFLASSENTSVLKSKGWEPVLQ
jgi:molybdate transport system substrate-binding protein